PVSVNLQDQELADALPIIFANQQLKYEVTGKVILITPIATTSRVLSVDTPEEWDMHQVQQTQDIRGRVVDSLGAPILGTSVRVLQAGTRSTIAQVATDRSGAFILKQVPLDA